jgi:hypothetical protein
MRMTWECSECGHIERRPYAPVKCHECGTIGTFFMTTEDSDDDVLDPTAAWFAAGMKRAIQKSRRLSAHLD